MDLFEYQGKQYFARFDIPVLPGAAADSVDEAVKQADQLGYPVVVKAQVQVGGRDKAGGIKVANNTQEARLHASNILGMDIKGHTVRRVWIEKAMSIKKEYYASFTLDRSAKLYLGMLSAQGGVDIEEVAAKTPQAIAMIHINPLDGLSETVCREWVSRAHLDAEAEAGVVSILQKLYHCFVAGDANLVEINPLILGTDGKVYVLDAKVTLDAPAAMHRHEDWHTFEIGQSTDEREAKARELGLQYVGLSGSVGIMANGAGLAMSTLDIVNQVGGQPANFLDIGGGANADVVANALTVINSDPNVKVIFINVFGGITRGEEVATGIIEGMRRVTVKCPVIVRLDGTNADEGRAILDAHASARLIRANTMLDAAQRAVAIAEGK